MKVAHPPPKAVIGRGGLPGAMGRATGFQFRNVEARRKNGEIFPVAVDATATWPVSGLQDTLAWRILGALADSVRFEVWNGAPAIHIVKRMLGSRV